MATVAIIVVQDQVGRSSLGTMAPSSPILQVIALETPKFWSPRGDLELMMTNGGGSCVIPHPAFQSHP